MSVPAQRIGSPLDVADCDSLAINDVSLPRSGREGDPNSSYQILWEDGDRVFCRRWRVGDDGNWSAVLVVLPVAAHPSRSNLDRLAHAYELKDALWLSALNSAIERVDQISTNRHGGRLWVSANEPRDVVFQFTLPAAQEELMKLTIRYAYRLGRVALVPAAVLSVIRGILSMEIAHKRRPRSQAVAAQFLLGIAGLALITFICFRLGFGLGRTGFAYVIVVALVSLLGSFTVSVVLSIVAAACLNYFFAPPLFELRIDVPEDIERIAAFLTTSLIVTALTTKLRNSEAHFRTFVDRATDAFFLLDDKSTVLDVNRQACDGLGYSREELIGKHRSDFDVGLDEASIELLRQRMAAGEPVTFETRHRRKDGTSFPVEVRVGQFNQVGRRYLCLVRDITERKRAEDELRESEERFRTLVQFSFDVYWESDAQHRFIRQEFAEGLADAPAPSSEIGKTRWEVPYLEPDAEAWRKHRETLDAHLPFRDFELARPTPDGGKRYVSVSGLPIFDKTGRFIGYRGVGRNITEGKRAEDELRESEERFRTLVQFSFDVYWESDAQHRIIRQKFAEGLAYEEAPVAEIGKNSLGDALP